MTGSGEAAVTTFGEVLTEGSTTATAGGAPMERAAVDRVAEPAVTEPVAEIEAAVELATVELVAFEVVDFDTVALREDPLETVRCCRSLTSICCSFSCKVRSS